jgi:hypothetical protein
MSQAQTPTRKRNDEVVEGRESDVVEEMDDG